jgi:hypothetical protein
MTVDAQLLYAMLPAASPGVSFLSSGGFYADERVTAAAAASFNTEVSRFVMCDV